MNRRIFILIAFAGIVGISTQAQIPDNFIRIKNSDDMEITKENTYVESSLFGYMNGGAELFLEYGFDRLVMTEMQFEGMQINAEVFKMKDKAAAFGIYSVSTYRCDDAHPLSDIYCQNSYQVQICSGKYYINIINHSGSGKGLAKCREIADLLLAQVKETDFNVFSYLAREEIPLSPEKITLISGDIALNNSAYEYSIILESLKEYNAIIAEYPEFTKLVIIFEEKEKAISYLEREAKSRIELLDKEIDAEVIGASLDDNGNIIIRIDRN